MPNLDPAHVGGRAPWPLRLPSRFGIYTYNPALDKFKNDPSSRFELDYPVAPLLTVLGITRTGAANDVKKEAESPAGDDHKAAPEE